MNDLCVKVCKRDGSEFKPNSLYHIVCGIMRYLRWNGHPAIDFFTDLEFITRSSLDTEVKRLQSCGKGSTKRQQNQSKEDEDLLYLEMQHHKQ